MNYIQSYANGKSKRKHQIIMENHIGRELKENEVIHHIDGNKRNNDLSNLMLVTREEHTKIHKDLLDKSKAVIQMTKNGEFIKKWKSAKQAERELGIYNSNISKCCHGKLKTTGGFSWKFVDCEACT